MKSGHDASIVYLSLGRLLLEPPRRIAYHRMARSVWPTYVGGERRGKEAHWTGCGLLIYEGRERRLQGVRLDNARLIARPCWRCWA